MGKVYLTPLYRAAWADMMAGDARLTPIAVRVAIMIGGYFNSGSAETFVGQETLARDMGISSKTVWLAINELVKLGYLIERQGGRASNTYTMPVENVARYCEIYTKKSRNSLRDYGAEISQTNDKISQNRADNIVTGDEQTLSLNSKINSTSNLVAFDPHQKLWAAVIQRIIDRLGADIVANWIIKLSIAGISAGTCWLAAPNKFIATYCMTHFVDIIKEAFKECQPTIDRICIEVVKLPTSQIAKRTQGGAA